MIRFLSFFSLFAVLLISPAAAQEDAGSDANADAVLTGQEQAAPQVADEAKDETKDEADYEQRLELSRKMHKIWPVRSKIETALDIVSEQIPQQERLKFKAGMRKAIKFDALEEASIDAMADIFSVKELAAMIAFYGSKEGRSVSHKTGDYERALQPVMIKMIDKALLDIKLGSQ